jgi:hypothetical protein
VFYAGIKIVLEAGAGAGTTAQICAERGMPEQSNCCSGKFRWLGGRYDKTSHTVGDGFRKSPDA